MWIHFFASYITRIFVLFSCLHTTQAFPPFHSFSLCLSSRLFLSPGCHYCWKLWARWTHQEPQRDRYRWVAKLKSCSFFHPNYPSLTYSSSATQRVFLNLPRDAFQWPPSIILSAGLQQRCQEDESLCLHQDNPRADWAEKNDQRLGQWELSSRGKRLVGFQRCSLVSRWIKWFFYWLFFLYNIKLSFVHVVEALGISFQQLFLCVWHKMKDLENT